MRIYAGAVVVEAILRPVDALGGARRQPLPERLSERERCGAGSLGARHRSDIAGLTRRQGRCNCKNGERSMHSAAL
jgi:hypothetical protein